MGTWHFSVKETALHLKLENAYLRGKAHRTRCSTLGSAMWSQLLQVAWSWSIAWPVYGSHILNTDPLACSHATPPPCLMCNLKIKLYHSFVRIFILCRCQYYPWFQAFRGSGILHESSSCALPGGISDHAPPQFPLFHVIHQFCTYASISMEYLLEEYCN